MNKRKLIIVLSGIGILAVSYGAMNFFASQKEETEKKTLREYKKYVKTEEVKYQNVPTDILTYGRVRTAEKLDLIAQVSGRMTEGRIPLKEGQRFKKGTLLYKIDDTEARLNVKAQKSNFLRDLAAILPDLKVDYPTAFDRWKEYFENIELDEQLPEIPTVNSTKEKTFLATKNIYSSYYSIKSAEENLRKYWVYAPFDGTIYNVNLQSGSFVNPGVNIAQIIESGNVEVKVDVDVKDIEWIEKGGPAYLSTESGASNWIGRVTRISDFVNENTQSIDVYIEIKNREYPVYAGQYLKAVIPGKQVPDGMLIPREALFNGNEVFLLQDTLLKVKEVRIHKINQESVVINGIAEGEDIVVEALVNAYNNMKAYKLENQEDKVDVEGKRAKDKLISSR